jgi:hypothetical protein
MAMRVLTLKISDADRALLRAVALLGDISVSRVVREAAVAAARRQLTAPEAALSPAKVEVGSA